MTHPSSAVDRQGNRTRVDSPEVVVRQLRLRALHILQTSLKTPYRGGWRGIVLRCGVGFGSGVWGVFADYSQRGMREGGAGVAGGVGGGGWCVWDREGPESTRTRD